MLKHVGGIAAILGITSFGAIIFSAFSVGLLPKRWQQYYWDRVYSRLYMVLYASIFVFLVYMAFTTGLGSSVDDVG
jgi:hypothetical protein